MLSALVSRLYERRSIIVTSSRGFEQWGEILGDARVAAALQQIDATASPLTPSEHPALPPTRALRVQFSTALDTGSVQCLVRLIDARRMTQGPTLLPPGGHLKDPLAVIAVSAAPIVLEGRYRLLVGALIRLRHSRRGGWTFGVGYAAVAIALALLAARHFATTSWPLSSGDPGLLVAAALLLLLAQALKAFGWARLFRSDERPSALALAAGNGGAALIGVVLPGRFDDAMRIAVVRRYPGCPAGVRALALSLVMLGLIDSAALTPLASVGAALPGAGNGIRIGLAVVAAGGVAAAVVIVALPRLSASERALRFRLGRWLSPRTTSLRRASEAWALVSACWLVRAVACFVLLGTLGIGFSFPLALLFLCAGAAAAALPIGPAGTAVQVGAGATALIASGSGASQALAVAVSVAALGVLSGAAIVLFAIAWRIRMSLSPTWTPLA